MGDGKGLKVRVSLEYDEVCMSVRRRIQDLVPARVSAFSFEFDMR
jgi:hypothetical protein